MTFDKLSVQLCSISKKENAMEILTRTKEKLGVFGEWASIVGPILGMFLFVHHENTRLSLRLDATNQRIDTNFIEINKRADILHHEFVDLLKEKRKEG